MVKIAVYSLFSYWLKPLEARVNSNLCSMFAVMALLITPGVSILLLDNSNFLIKNDDDGSGWSCILWKKAIAERWQRMVADLRWDFVRWVMYRATA